MRSALAQVLLWILLLLSIGLVLLSVLLAAANTSEYDFLYVPFAAWFVFGLDAVILALAALVLLYRRRLSRARRDLQHLRQTLSDVQREVASGKLPVIHGHECLKQAEFPTLIQSLFRDRAGIEYVDVTPLPGGYSGSTTVLVKLKPVGGKPFLPIHYVVKLGRRDEIAGESDKLDRYVKPVLARAPRAWKPAECGDWAGILYEFAGLELDGDVQGLNQFYLGHSALEVAESIDQVYSNLAAAWYKYGEMELVDLYQEYVLLSRKREEIIGHVEKIVEEGDPYRTNFVAAEDRLRENLKPGFCPAVEIPWHDPVVFLKQWPKRKLVTPIHRSVVHGDLNARNVLIEIKKSRLMGIWLIDFSHTGNGLSQQRTDELARAQIPVRQDRGHTLRDFCRLEADVKFLLTPLHDEDDLRKAVIFENALMEGELALADLNVAPPPAVEALRDERFIKAWHVIRDLRKRAAIYLDAPHDVRPYYLSLLHATLPIVYYQPGQFSGETYEKQQKRYALIAAGMCAAKLTDLIR